MQHKLQTDLEAYRGWVGLEESCDKLLDANTSFLYE